jgi:hypothetical protein
MSYFTYEDDVKIKNKHAAGISIENISRPPQSREIIPLKKKRKKDDTRGKESY